MVAPARKRKRGTERKWRVSAASQAKFVFQGILLVGNQARMLVWLIHVVSSALYSPRMLLGCP
jgi:hypothetical protein